MIPTLFTFIFILVESTFAQSQNNIYVHKDDKNIQLNIREQLKMKPGSFQDMSTLLRTVNLTSLGLTFPKQTESLDDKIYSLPGLRNGNKVDYFYMRGGSIFSINVINNSDGFIIIQDSMISNLTSKPEVSFPICSNIAQQSDRVFVFCKEVQTSNPKTANLKIFSFLRADMFKVSQHSTVSSTFSFPLFLDRKLDYVYCTYKEGAENLGYFLVFDTPSSDHSNSDLLFIYTFKEKNIKSHFINVTSQILNYSRLNSLGCNHNARDGSKYLFLLTYDQSTSSTMISPISGGIIMLYLTTPNYKPPSSIPKFTFLSGTCFISYPLIIDSNSILLYQQDSTSFRYIRVTLASVTLESITLSTVFLSHQVEIVKFPLGIITNFSSVRSMDNIQGVVVTFEFIFPGTSSRIVDIFLNEKLDGVFVQKFRLVSSHSSFSFTLKNTTNSLFDLEYFLVEDTGTSPTPVFKERSLYSIFSLSSLNMGLNVDLLPENFTFGRLLVTQATRNGQNRLQTITTSQTSSQILPQFN